jgi:hypothetical protein
VISTKQQTKCYQQSNEAFYLAVSLKMVKEARARVVLLEVSTICLLIGTLSRFFTTCLEKVISIYRNSHLHVVVAPPRSMLIHIIINILLFSLLIIDRGGLANVRCTLLLLLLLLLLFCSAADISTPYTRIVDSKY